MERTGEEGEVEEEGVEGDGWLEGNKIEQEDRNE
jgi:hypothetical protein